ncbi:hypothetical protein [Hymenobacter sp. 102]|uniref:hypothetical protein n=1 Tax=Hymenobacter sp. 102 TaxID=3403152 RepID=UPI003CE8848D
MENKYYSFSIDGSVKEYISLEKTNEQPNLFSLIETISYWENGKYKNTNLSYEIFKEGKKEKTVEIGSYSLHAIEVLGNEYFQGINIWIKFTDKNGKIHSPGYSFGNGINGIEKAIRFLIKLNEFENYENYVLHQANQDLKKKIQRLELKIQSLTNSK